MNQEEIMQQLQAGMQALHTGNLDIAENTFRSILSKDASEVHSLHFLGVIFCQKGNLDDGVALIEQSIRLDPSRFGPYLNLGRFLVGANQWDPAVAALEQAVQRDAHDFDAWSMLAQASFYSDDPDAALIAGKKAAEINPGNAEIFFSLGVYASEKNQDEAIDYYRNAVSIDPASFKAWVNLGNCLLDSKRIEESIAAFNAAIEIDPSCFQALMGLCRTYGDLAKWLEALDMAKQALSLDPSSHDAAFWVGYSLHKLDRKKEAVNAYRVALAISPVAAQTHLYLASALEGLSEEQDALKHYELATKVDPKLSLAFTYWGALLQKGGDLGLAIKKYRQAINSDPLSVDAYLGLGVALHEDGRSDEAIPIYRRAIEIKPDFADAYLNLGIVLKEEGEVEGAVNAFAEHYRLSPIAQGFSFDSESASLSLNAATEVKVPDGAEFIPSYVSDAIPFGMHLMYVHIPKAGGIRFSSPIFSCIQEMLLKGGWEKFRDLAASAFGRQGFAAMASHRINSAPMRDGIMAAFSSYDLPSLDFSFLTPHGISSHELSLAIRDQFDVWPTRLATWRDPRKRLKSALDYLYRTSEGDLGLVREKIDQKDPFLDNAIYRGCFSDFSSQVSPDERRDAQVDYLIDIGDFSVMNQIMRSFLTSCRLPNIVVNKKVNVTSADKRMDAATADSLMEQCVEAGFISLDCASEIEQMVSKELPAYFDQQFDPSSASLHPLTFVVSAATDVETSINNCLLPTEYLLTHEGQEFLRKTFA